MKNLTSTFQKQTPAMNGQRIIFSAIALLIANFFFFSSAFSQIANTCTYTSSGTFVAPAGVDIVTAQAWGGGGAGSMAIVFFPTPLDLGTGGGGGAYSAGTVTVSAPYEYTVTVGLGGSGSGSNQDGGDSWFRSQTKVKASGGGGASHDDSGTGGAATTGYGNIVKYSGGDGDWKYPLSSKSGGGGGGAGTTGSGGDASGCDYGTGTYDGGGNGGAGRISDGDGNSGQICGGGGGGATAIGFFHTNDGGVGARGKVIVSWDCPTYSLVSVSGESFSGSAITSITLNGLPEGLYTVLYNTTNPTQTGLTASVAVNSTGSGTFTATGLTAAAPSSSIITITFLTSGSTPGGYCCGNEITSNNTTIVDKLCGQLNSDPGTALDFDGLNDYVQLSQVLPIGNVSNTFECWVKVPLVGTNSLATGEWVGTLLGNFDNSPNINYEINDQGKLLFQWNDFQLLGTTNLRDNQWHHIAFVRDKVAEEIVLYLDGAVEKTHTGTVPDTTLTTTHRLGCDNMEIHFLHGKMEEVRIWTTARTQEQIRKSMHIPINCNEAGLIYYYYFNEGTGNQLYDAISENNGTLINMDNADWIASTIPFGLGFANSQTEDFGIVDFVGTGLSMDFQFAGTANITAARIDTLPNMLPIGTNGVFDEEYWVVHHYGTDSFNVDLSFTLEQDLTSDDENDPSRIHLNSRPSNSDICWTLNMTADSVNAAANTVTFRGITTLCQFMISKDFPRITLADPYNLQLISDNFNSIDVGGYSAPAFTDLDGDGLLDLIIGAVNGKLNHYKQGGSNSSSFWLVTASFNSIDVGRFSAPTFTDLDGDGLLDLIIGEEDGNLNHYKQDAFNSLSFTFIDQSPINSINVGEWSAPTFTDLDGDGLLDLIIGKQEGNLSHYVQYAINSSSFALITPTFNSIDLEGISAPTFTDLDGDGLLDLIIGEYAGKLYHYKQGGPNSSSFWMVTANFNPGYLGSRPTPTFTDIDGDGLQDLIIGKSDGKLSHSEQEVLDELNFGSLLIGNSSSLKSYLVRADHLLDDLLIECPGGFKVSLNESSGYAQGLAIAPIDEKICTPVYVKFESLTDSSYTGNLVHTTTEATTKNIALTGQGRWIDGFPGTALDFDGTNDYASTVIDVNPTVNPAMTWEAWVYPTRVNYGSRQFVFSHDDGGWDRTVGIPANSSFWEVHTGSEDWEVVEIDLNTWQHIAVVFDDDNNKLYFYKNGIQYEYNGATDYGSSNLKLNIGKSPEGQSYFQGKVDEGRIWDVARTDNEIRENMHLPLTGTETGLISYWQVNEGGGTMAYDLVSGNHGTLHNMDNSDWKPSTIPFGAGFAATQVNPSGTVSFTGTGLSMEYNSSGNDSITVARIDTLPNILPECPFVVLDEQYWVVNRYGTGTFDANLTFTTAEELAMDPSLFLLYSRPSTSDTEWMYVTSASSVNTTEKKVTFEGITHFSQFIILKLNDREIDGFPGTALSFDGSTDYVECGNDPNLNIANNISVEAWIKPDIMIANSQIIKKGVLSFLYWDAELEDIPGKGIQIYLPGLADYWEFHRVMDFNTWVHVAWTYDNSGNLTAYVNGEITRQSNFPGSISMNTDALEFASSTDEYNGLLDEVRIWNVVRTSEQIRENMHLPLSGTETGLISYWQFNEGFGSTATDLISGNFGNLYNMDNTNWISSTIPFGSGFSGSQAEATGIVDFSGTGLSMDFQTAGGAEISVSRIDSVPNIPPMGSITVLDEQYWVVNRYGTGTFDANLTFSTSEELTVDPSLLKLFSRSSTSDTEWDYVASASSVDSINKKVTFEGITDFSQFIVGRLEVDGFPYTALDFDGEDDYVQLNQVLPIGSVSSTFECWVKVPLVNTGNLTTGERVGILLGNFYSPSSQTIAFEINANGLMRYYWNNGGGSLIDFNGITDLRDNQWHHLSFIRDKNGGQCIMYLDGAVENTYTGIGSDLTLTYTHRIGCDNRTSGAINFHGKIEECRVWNVARTKTEIRESMHLPLSGTETGLISYWQFNEGTGTTAIDLISGNYGNLYNMDNTDWISSTIPFGAGFADSQPETNGTVVYTETGLSMDFASQNGAGITAARIDLAPNLLPAGQEGVFDEQYWVINRYGTGSFDAALTFTLAEDLTINDENNPSSILLYKRASTSDTDWEFVTSATSVSVANNDATFTGITDFSQFIIGKLHSIIELDLNVFLEGPYNGTDMNIHLNTASDLPLSQPYTNPPWNYPETDSVITFPNSNIVDWVLIELRDAQDADAATRSTFVARQAAFILNNGSVVAMDGSTNLLFDVTISEQLFVVLWHRNHLGIMSAIPLAESEGIYSYDFTNASGQAHGIGSQKDLGSGKFGMIAGDANGDGIVNDTDKNPVWNTQAGISGYLSADLNMDGQCNNQDKDELWFPNRGYGSQVYFTYSPCPGIPNITYAGQTYNTVQIGEQCWLKENLNVGTMIQGFEEMTNNDTIEKYCYNNDPTNCASYGGLYQWDEMMQYTTLEGAQGICPEGWHIPTYGEWDMLIDFLGGDGIAGGKMKEAGTLHWSTPNTGATNESGFTALPGGLLDEVNGFHAMGTYCNLWSSYEFTGSYAGLRRIYTGGTSCYTSSGTKIFPASVRCIKDN